jgi:uncharacterized HAD superfamily protein
MKKNKVILIDIDGTICSEEKTFERSLAVPIEGSVREINKLFDDGNTIILWTARGWEQFKMTKVWLEENGYKFDQLLMGKPIVDLIIDDRCLKFEGWNINYADKE